MSSTSSLIADRASDAEARPKPSRGRGLNATVARRSETMREARHLAPAQMSHRTEQHPGKRLSQVIRAVRDQFFASEVDDVERLARGVILCLRGRSPAATVSHEPTRGHLRIDVRLDRVRNPEEAQVRDWLSVNGQIGLAWVSWDREDGTLWLRGATHRPYLDDQAVAALRALIRDVRKLLRQEPIAAVMNRASRRTGG